MTRLVPTLELGRKPVYDEPSETWERKSRKSHTITPTKQRLPKHTSVAVGTDLVWEARILGLTAKVDELERKLASTRACTLEIDNTQKYDSKVQFYTSFPSKGHLKIRMLWISWACCKPHSVLESKHYYKTTKKEVWTPKKAVTIGGVLLDFM